MHINNPTNISAQNIQHQIDIQQLIFLLQKKHIQEYIIQQNQYSQQLLILMKNTLDSQQLKENMNFESTDKNQPQKIIETKQNQNNKKLIKSNKFQNIQPQIASSNVVYKPKKKSQHFIRKQPKNMIQNLENHLQVQKPVNTGTEKIQSRQIQDFQAEGQDFSLNLSEAEADFIASSKSFELNINNQHSITQSQDSDEILDTFNQSEKIDGKLDNDEQFYGAKSLLKQNVTPDVVENNFSTQQTTKFIADCLIQKKINFYLQTLIAEKVPVIMILEKFEVQSRIESSRITINRTYDWLEVLEQEINKLKNPKQFTELREESQLLLEMVQIIHEKINELEINILKCCKYQRFKIKLIKIRQIIEKGFQIRGIDVKQLFYYLSSFESLVQQKLTNKLKEKKQTKGYLENKIIDMFCADIFQQSIEDQIPLPQILLIFYFQNASTIQKCIKVIPDISFLDKLIKKTGYYHLKETYDYQNIEQKSFFELRELASEMKCNLKFQTSCYKVCKDVLTFAATQINKIDKDELRQIINHQSVQLLKQKLNTFYPQEISINFKFSQSLPLFLGCIIQYFEYNLEKKIFHSVQDQSRSIRIPTELMMCEFQITHKGKLLSLDQQKKCRAFFKLFLDEISTKKIAFPQCLAMFIIKKKKLVLFKNNIKLIGLMLISKQILSFFIQCLQMEQPRVQRLNFQKFAIDSVPFLNLEKDSEKYDLDEIFIRQVNLLHSNQYLIQNFTSDLYDDIDFCNLIESEDQELCNSKLQDSFKILRDIKNLVVKQKKNE